MVKGVEKKPVPYVLEDDRNSPLEEQTVFHIMPKTGHDSNRTLQRYAAASKDGRKGSREISVQKLDSADIEEFLAIVSKVEVYQFPSHSALYESGPTKVIDTPEGLREVCVTMSSDYLAEVFEAANNLSRLTDGAKKNSKS